MAVKLGLPVWLDLWITKKKRKKKIFHPKQLHHHRLPHDRWVLVEWTFTPPSLPSPFLFRNYHDFQGRSSGFIFTQLFPRESEFSCLLVVSVHDERKKGALRVNRAWAIFLPSVARRFHSFLLTLQSKKGNEGNYSSCAVFAFYCYFMPLLFIVTIEFKTSAKSRNCLFIIDSTYDSQILFSSSFKTSCKKVFANGLESEAWINCTKSLIN